MGRQGMNELYPEGPRTAGLRCRLLRLGHPFLALVRPIQSLLHQQAMNELSKV
jgi:hypothetical protein